MSSGKLGHPAINKNTTKFPSKTPPQKNLRDFYSSPQAPTPKTRPMKRFQNQATQSWACHWHRRWASTLLWPIRFVAGHQIAGMKLYKTYNYIPQIPSKSLMFFKEILIQYLVQIFWKNPTCFSGFFGSDLVRSLDSRWAPELFDKPQLRVHEAARVYVIFCFQLIPRCAAANPRNLSQDHKTEVLRYWDVQELSICRGFTIFGMKSSLLAKVWLHSPSATGTLFGTICLKLANSLFKKSPLSSGCNIEHTPRFDNSECLTKDVRYQCCHQNYDVIFGPASHLFHLSCSNRN